MPPAPKCDVGVVIFDLDGPKQETLLKLLHKFVAWSFDPCQVQPYDKYELLLANSGKTTNVNYPNVTKTDIRLSTESKPKDVLNCVRNAEAGKGDWLDALLLAIELVKEFWGVKGVINRKIIFLTSLKQGVTIDQTKIAGIIKELNSYEIYLYIIGPEVDLPRPIMCNADIPQLMRDLEVDRSNPSMIAARQLGQGAEKGVLCNAKLGFDLLWSFREPKGQQPWQVPLSFGTTLQIPVMTIAAYRKEKPVTLVVTAKAETYKVLAEDESVRVDDAEIVRGIVLHDKFVNVESNDMFKEETERGNDILGFTHKDNVPEIYLQDEVTYYVMPQPGAGAGQANAFYNLVDVLFDQGKYAILRRVYNKNNRPKFYALIPNIEVTPKCFVMALLPQADDLIAKLKYDTETKNIGIERDQNCKSFLDSLDITRQDCRVPVPLSPEMMVAPYCGRLADVCVSKETGEGFDFEDIEFDIGADIDNPHADALRNAWKVDD